MTYQKSLIYLFLICNLAVILFFWWDTSGILLSGNQSSVLISLGRIAGLLTAFLVLTQFILIGRVRWLEKFFGFDRLSRFHHWVGITAFTALSLHLIFLTTGYGLISNHNFWQQIISFLYEWDDVAGALGAFSLLVLIIASSIIIVRKRLKYEAWHFVHLATYAAILLAFGHQFEYGNELLASQVFRNYWVGLYVFVFVNLIVYRFLRPLYLFYRFNFRVAKVTRETHDAISIYITGRNLKDFQFLAGQFSFWYFLDKHRWWEGHPFSFSAAPNGEYLRITVKNSGDFTEKLSRLKIGTPVMVDGPYGYFTRRRTDNKKILLIAGGVGITPIRSLAEDLKNSDNLVLLYGNKTKNDIIFAQELHALEDERFIIHDIISDDVEWSGEQGRIDGEKIQRLVPDWHERDIYLCGPVVMMKAVTKTLVNLGKPKRKIYFEKFTLGN